mmetsp:Transcript_23778/g.43058  ORF Transcript_23778/g.43058 Transcript_23778/m.43058 type:complete len:222 (-) Transcript_23778:1370-2035(-)
MAKPRLREPLFLELLYQAEETLRHILICPLIYKSTHHTHIQHHNKTTHLRPSVRGRATTRKVGNVTGTQSVLGLARVRIMMCPHRNNILTRGGRTHRIGSISVSRIPRRNQNQKFLVVVHVLIKIPCLGSVGINLRSPGGAVDIGAGAARIEEYGIEGEVEFAFTVANVSEGDFRSGSNTVGHAFAIESLPSDGSGNVRAVSILVVAIVLEILILDNFSGS